ncbi:Glycosyltransferase involved in cell wall bisynthesis [Aromatoleum tolulyticum]|uniref:Glycosyltransferase involved in cell wall bisynthesis n=1 Tax=Aromatoleum tolulyticum TaxID=34027 RepID=A0A1N7CKI0_9RHOO|nr:glycosyltransferase family 1 protein [Aromatoleum tolulyticum]SIR64089.1 Glycosyltransferase involved in cell wall bisynthesis [Aromatoleum tolulyticum]
MKDVDFVTEERCLRPSLRIALVTETWAPEINGVAMTLGRMVDGLIARGHRVQLVRPRQALSDRAADGPGFEEVLAHGMKIPNYEGLRFGLPARTRLFRLWSRQRPDLVHVATEGPLGWSAVSASIRLGIPVTSDFHTNFDSYSAHYGVGWLERPVAAWLKRMHNRTAVTFVPTRAMAQDLRARGYRSVEVIARGVDTELFNPARRSAALRASWGVAADELAVVWVGRVAPEKNLRLVLEAFAAIRRRTPDARLVIVGDGPLRKSLQEGNPDVVFAGARRGEDLAAHYASGDLFLFPSLSETWGNVTLEAMASGLCVVAYDCAAAAEVIASGGDGLLVRPGAAAAFVAESVVAASDRGLRARIAEAARRRSESLDWERINDRFTTSLQRVVDEAQAALPDFLPFKATVR